MFRNRFSAQLAWPAPPASTPGRDLATWEDLSPQTAAAVMSHLRIIDVRQPHEFHGDLGHLPGAELAPLDRLDGRIGIWDPNEPVLVVCRSGKRSSAACQRLVEAGFREVYNLDGGMLGWQETGHVACATRHPDEARRCSGHGG